MTSTRFVTLTVGLAGWLFLAGCGGGTPLAEVEGIVKLKGKPLDKIQVEFWPIEQGQRSMGTTDAEGRFTLLTDGGKRGAAIGPHKVVLRDVAVLGDQFLGRKGEEVDITKGKKSRIGSEYEDPHKTPIKKDVTAAKNVIEIEVSP